MTTPTESASAAFRQFGRLSRDNARLTNVSDVSEVGVKVVNISYALVSLADGLDQLGVGLRATYLLLEQVQASLRKMQQNRP